MTTRDLMLAAVVASPDDDLPRLVMADHLDESGEAEYAEFVRVQVELAKVPEPGYKTIAPLFGSADPSYYPDAGICTECRRTRPERCRYHTLARRERELWEGRGWVYFQPPGWPQLTAYIPQTLPAITSFVAARGVILRRGFVAKIHCTLADWCETCLECGGYGNVHASGECRSDFTGIGPAAVRRHPVRTVRVTDRQPDARAGQWVWWAEAVHGGNDHLPRDVFDRLTGFFTASANSRVYLSGEAALSALSDALLHWAKSQPAPA